MADKKISQLPLIQTISGSTTVVPIVHDGTTVQIPIERLSLFASQFSATTGSNTFIGNQIITGNTSIGGNLTVAGVLTAQEYYSEITSASIIYQEGSTIFGNSVDDTHQFTGVVSINGITIGAGAINEFTASQIGKDETLKVVTSSLNQFTASQDSRNFVISQYTASTDAHIVGISEFTSSQLAVNLRISSTTGSINTTTASFDSVFLRISSVTGSINTTTSSFDSVFLGISSVTGAMNTTTSSFDSVFLRISSTTGSINTTTSSFDSVFLGISSVTGAMNTTTSSFDSVFFGISSVTGAMNTQSSSQQNVNSQIGIATSSLNFTTGALNSFTGSIIGQTTTISTFTASVNFTTQSLNTQTGSQESINTTISIVTGSMRAEIGGIEAYTASLKSAITVNGTNVQIIGDLNVNKLNVQYISSSVLVTSGSNTFGDQATDKHEFTGSVAVSGKLYVNDSATNFLIEGNGFSQTYLTSNGAIVLNPGSGGVEMVGSNRTFKATDITADGFVSGEIRATNNVVSSSTQVQNYDVFALNSNLYTSTGSLIAITNELMSYTASLKGAAIVSSSQQIKNYIEFVNNSVTSSMNVNSASIAYKATNVVGSAGRILFNNATDTTTTSANLEWNGSKLAVNGDISFGYSQTLQSSLDPTNNISLHDGSFGVIAIRNGGTDRITLYRTTDTIQLSGSLLVNPNNPSAKHEITGSINATGSLRLTGSLGVVGIIGGTNDVTAWNGNSALQGAAAVCYYTNDYFRFKSALAGTGVALTVGTVDYLRTNATGTQITGSLNVTGSAISINGTDVFSTYGFDIKYSGISRAGINFNPSSGLIKIGGFTTADEYPVIYSDGVAALTFGLGATPSATFAGNVVVASGNGIDFSATGNSSGTMTSELLNDYEEGTWTPTVVAASGTYTTVTNQRGTYTKIGRQVTVQFYFIVSDKGTGTAGAQITNLPFTVKSTSAGDQYVGSMINTSTSVISSVIAGQNDTFAGIYKYDATDPITATQGNAGSLTYFV